MNILAVVAHPDDEVYIFGTLMKHKEAGDNIMICYMTLGRDELKEKNAETLNGIKDILNSKYITFMYPDQTLDTIKISELSARLSKVVEDFNPDVVYTHINDLNLDHRLTREATLIACRPYTSTAKEIYGFEVQSNNLVPDYEFKPLYFNDISNHIQIKMIAYTMYGYEIDRKQTKELILNRNTFWGLVYDTKFMEAFEIIRIINKEKRKV
jgi:LmbE family N-acetylglucosaminyl deacetylase